jgi:hypothetical protein
MATATSTITEPPIIEEQTPTVYGCEHIESILNSYGGRARQEYDSAMSIVIQSSPKIAKVKVFSRV